MVAPKPLLVNRSMLDIFIEENRKQSGLEVSMVGGFIVAALLFNNFLVELQKNCENDK